LVAVNRNDPPRFLDKAREFTKRNHRVLVAAETSRARDTRRAQHRLIEFGVSRTTIFNFAGIAVSSRRQFAPSPNHRNHA
jgi:hypothetical protein